MGALKRALLLVVTLAGCADVAAPLTAPKDDITSRPHLSLRPVAVGVSQITYDGDDRPSELAGLRLEWQDTTLVAATVAGTRWSFHYEEIQEVGTNAAPSLPDRSSEVPPFQKVGIPPAAPSNRSGSIGANLVSATTASREVSLSYRAGTSTEDEREWLRHLESIVVTPARFNRVFTYDDSDRVVGIHTERFSGGDSIGFDREVIAYTSTGCPSVVTRNGSTVARFGFENDILSSYSNGGRNAFAVRFDNVGNVVGFENAPTLQHEAQRQAGNIDLNVALLFGGIWAGFPSHPELFTATGECHGSLDNPRTIVSLVLSLLADL